MAESILVATQAPLLNPMQRLINIFIAPSKTFADIRRSAGWWVPFLVAALIGVLYGFVVLHKVGVPALVEDAIHQSTRQQDQMANATPEQAAQIRRITGISIKSILYVSPVFSFLFGLISAGVLLASANFGAGGRAKFKEMLAVWFYAALPLVLFFLLVIVAILTGVTGESFNLKNPIGTNIGFYFIGGELPKPLIAVLSALDIFAIWMAVLLTIGVSIVAGIKRGAAAAIVFGWWFFFILLQAGGAAFG